MTELRAGTPKEAGILPERVSLIRDRCATWVKGGITPSLVVLAARRGVIFLHEAFGQLRPEPDSPPLETGSVFALASLTKPLTATLVMQLVEDGLLGLNRPIRDYIPEICGEGTEELLVHHLLTHTSGYRDDPVHLRLFQRWGKEELPPCEPTNHPICHEAGQLVHDVPLTTKPGEIMSYCNHNYEILGELVRRLSGRTIEDHARERLFDPLGMVDSYYVVPEAVDARVVKRPAHAFMAQPIGPFFQGIDSRRVQEAPFTGSGGFSRAIDMGIFGQMLLNGGMYGRSRILTPASVGEMTRNQIPGLEAEFRGGKYKLPEASWGFGFRVHGNGKWRYYGGSLLPSSTFDHSGGAGTMIWVDPVNEIVGVYLSVVVERTERDENIWNLDLYQNLVTASVAD